MPGPADGNAAYGGRGACSGDRTVVIALVICFLLFLLAARVDWLQRHSTSKRVVSWEDFAHTYDFQNDKRPVEPR